MQDLLKEVAQTQQVDQSAKQRFKVVVINEADHLTRDAQAALRRTMEKYSPNLRLILLANSTANIIAPIRSRTLLVRVAAPTETEICDVLERSARKEGWVVAKELNARIAKESGRNLRRALLMYEAVHAQKYVSFLLHKSQANGMLQRESNRQNTHPSPRLGSLDRPGCKGDHRGALPSTDPASSSKTLRSSHSLHSAHNYSQDFDVQAYTAGR